MRKSAVVYLLSAFVLVSSGVNAQEDLAQWAHSKEIVINTSPSGYDLKTDLHGFPYLVRLSRTDFDFSQAAGSGEDLRFAATGNAGPLAYQIELWDSIGGSAIVWVKIDTIHADDSTQSFTMHWGQPGATSRSNGAEVFTAENGFVGVWHLNEEGNNSENGFLDASSSGNHGSGTEFTAESKVPSAIGFGQNFQRSQFIFVPPLNLAANTVTMSAWVKLSGPQFRLTSPLFCRGESTIAGLSITGTELLYHWADEFYLLPTKLAVPTYRYAYVSLVVSPDSGVLYLGADKKLTSYVNRAPHAVEGFEGPISIGQDPEYGDRLLKGAMDEAVLSNVSRSEDWIRLCYLNQLFVSETPPTIAYQQDHYEIGVNIAADIKPEISDFVDSVSIEPPLPPSLKIDGSGAITGKIADTMSATTFYVRAMNEAGSAEDTITITARPSSKALSRMDQHGRTTPEIWALNANGRRRICFRVPSTQSIQFTELSIYDLKGARIWSRRIAGTGSHGGVQSIDIGASSSPFAFTGGLFLAEVSVFGRDGRRQDFRKARIRLAL